MPPSGSSAPDWSLLITASNSSTVRGQCTGHRPPAIPPDRGLIGSGFEAEVRRGGLDGRHPTCEMLQCHGISERTQPTQCRRQAVVAVRRPGRRDGNRRGRIYPTAPVPRREVRAVRTRSAAAGRTASKCAPGSRSRPKWTARGGSPPSLVAANLKCMTSASPWYYRGDKTHSSLATGRRALAVPPTCVAEVSPALVGSVKTGFGLRRSTARS